MALASITKEQRKKEIINYIKDIPGREVNDVLKYSIENGFGSKVTVTESIQELLTEGILGSGKEKRNSKSYRLVVNDNNMLLTMPRDLETLFIKFQDFVKIIAQLYNESSNKKPVKGISNGFYVTRAYKSIPMLPYDLIEIIDRIYDFYFIFLLPLEIKNRDLISKLYSIYFEMRLKMHSLVAKEINYIDSIKDLSSLPKSPMYKSYIHSDTFTGIRKVSDIVRICKVLVIDKSLFEVLDFLWITNKKFLPLVYEFSIGLSDYSINKYLNKLGKTRGDYYQYDDKPIKDIHIYIDYHASENRFDYP